ncbi:MAG: hypothetical protein ACK5B6_02530 [Bacteroidia bacterium]|jgi:hypothetical protein
MAVVAIGVVALDRQIKREDVTALNKKGETAVPARSQVRERLLSQNCHEDLDVGMGINARRQKENKAGLRWPEFKGR